MPRKRLTTGERKEIILTAAAILVGQEGPQSLTHEDVADRCALDTSVATVRRYFGSWDELANALARHPSCPERFRKYMESLK